MSLSTVAKNRQLRISLAYYIFCAKECLRGLMQAGKKNMERIAEVVPDSDEQVLLHFLSISKLGRARCPRARGVGSGRLAGRKRRQCTAHR